MANHDESLMANHMKMTLFYWSLTNGNGDGQPSALQGDQCGSAPPSIRVLEVDPATATAAHQLWLIMW